MKTSEVLRLAQPRARRFAPGLAFGVVSAACAVALLATAAYLITRAAEQPPILYLNMAIVGVRAFALARATLRYGERLASHDAAFRTLSALRVGIYRRLVPLAPDGLAGTRRGDLLARLVGDVDELQNLPLRVVQPLIVSGLVAIASVTFVWILLPAAGAALAVTLVLAFAIGAWVSTRVAGHAERRLAPLRGDFADRMLDLVSNLEVLSAFDALDERILAVRRADERLTAALRAKSASAGIVAGAVSLLAGVASILALLLGVPALAAGGALTGPTLAIVVLVPLAVFEVVGSVPFALGAWRQVRASAERVASALPDRIPAEIPVDRPEAEHPVARRSEAGALIELTGVSARWPGATEDSLAGVSLRIEPGDRVLVTGESGSGKTTLAHVLVRFLEPNRGRYEVGGVDAGSLPQDSVRRIVGLSEQTPYLFDDSIRQNLLFARDDADDARLVDVLERVGLGQWLDERGGLDALVGERGALVSGGQAQRIALARALLADFPVLVLDEPTANVDADRADGLVRDILTAVGDDRAVVLLSHTPVHPGLVTKRLHLTRSRMLTTLG
jgi:ATP-binding cassette subfamily C protein CydC